MGLLTNYLFYRAGKRRAERECDDEIESTDLDVRCDNCGLPLGYHVNDVRRSCPTHVLEIRDRD